MKVIHVPFCFPPDPVGGTEVYVEGLAHEQQRRGVDVVVAAPAPRTSCHLHNSLPVHRFAVSGERHLESLYGEGDYTASREFVGIVDRERPDIVHLHAFTAAVSGRLAQETRRRGIGLVFTYHTPTVSCQRGTLLRWGREVCDGKLEVHACAGCVLHGLGVDRRLGVLLGAVPAGVGQVVGGVGLAGGAWTGLRMTDLVRRQHTAFRSFMHTMDRIVVLCSWAGELLKRNGIPTSKLVVSRHGLAQANEPGDEPRISRAPVAGGPLRVAFLGRLHPTKGIDTLIRAMGALAGARLELDIYGVDEKTGPSEYSQSLRAMAAGDPRIRFCAPVASEEVPRTLRGYDLVAVPSRWMETGPLVVLEAFAAGVPVIGSRLGGIAELVDHGIDGLLVETESVPAWTDVLARLLQDADLLPRLRAGVRPPRRMSTVADEMLALYHELRPAA